MQVSSGNPAPPALSQTDAQFVRDLGGFMKYLLAYGQRGFFQAVADLDLSLSQIRMLHVLCRDPDGVSLGELAEQTGLTLPTASRTVDSLVQRGFATRAESETDRRMKSVRPTGEAVEATGRLIDLRLAGLEEFVSSLSPEERDGLAAALAPIVAREDIAPLCRAQKASEHA